MGCKYVQVLVLLGVCALLQGLADAVFEAKPGSQPNYPSPSPPPPTNAATPPPDAYEPPGPANSNISLLYYKSVDDFTNSVEPADGVVLVSENKSFSFRLRILNESSCAAVVRHDVTGVAIWVTNFEDRKHSPGVKVTNCNLSFNNTGLVLSSNADTDIWTVGRGRNAELLTLDNSGNLMLLKKDNGVVWKSFDNPTDVLATSQILVHGFILNAAQRNGEYSTGGLFSLQVDQLQVALYENFENENPNPRWVPYYNIEVNGTQVEYLVVEKGGFFGALANNTNFTILSAASGDWSYVKLTPDGGLSFFSYFTGGRIRNSTVKSGICSLPGQCGSYGVCMDENICTCPSGFKDYNETSPGCERKEVLIPGICNNTVVSVGGNTYIGMGSSIANIDGDSCVETCGLRNCTGEMALHVKLGSADKTGDCYCNLGTRMQTIRNITSEDFRQTLYLRIVKGSDQAPSPSPSSHSIRDSARKTAAVAFAAVAGALVVLLIALSALFLNYQHRRLFEDADNGKYDPAATGLLMLSNRQLPPEYTYQEVVDSTRSFAQKLGSGGFSCVYVGHLSDNTKVAIKKLNINNELQHEDEIQEFLEAVTTIGSISHANLVSLKGFCKEGQNRLLIYELVNEGRSLNWFLFPLKSSGFLMNTKTRRSIALGAARGLAHLHKDCHPSSIILHGCVKPENIVIDSRMQPRLVDFGLVNLTSRDSRLHDAQMRGSHAYMAPEWTKSQPITEKSDVYSLGIVILELVSGRRCLNQGTSPEKYFLPSWGFALLRQSDHDPDRVLELVDPLLDVHNLTETDLQVLKGMIYVALWCVQEDASMRPPMKEVVQMLDGNASVSTPPYSPALDSFGREMFQGYGERAPESSNNSFMHSTSLKRNSDMHLR